MPKCLLGGNADDLQNRGSQDPDYISLEQEWEARHWTERFGVSAQELRDAVAKVGPMATDVEQYLSKGNARVKVIQSNPRRGK